MGRFLLFCLMMFLASGHVEANVDTRLDDALNGVLNDFGDAFQAAGITRPHIVVDPIVDAVNRVQSPASIHIHGRLKHFVSGRFQLLSRQNATFASAYQTVASRGGGVVTRSAHSGQVEEFILSGTYQVVGDDIRLSFELREPYSNNKNVKAWVSQSTIAKDAIPSNVSLKTSVPVAVQAQNTLLSQPVLKQKSQDLELEMLPDKGNGAVYKKGEYLSLVLRATRDCYVRLYHIDQNGKMKYLFPKVIDNGRWAPAVKSEHQYKLKAGQVYVLPQKNYGARWSVSEPFGLDRIKAVVSSLPFTDDPTNLGSVLVDNQSDWTTALTRGLQEETMTAEAFCVFETTEF